MTFLQETPSLEAIDALAQLVPVVECLTTEGKDPALASLYRTAIPRVLKQMAKQEPLLAPEYIARAFESLPSNTLPCLYKEWAEAADKAAQRALHHGASNREIEPLTQKWRTIAKKYRDAKPLSV